MRLEHERLVEIRPQRGTFVFDCDTDEVRAMCELRAVLETGALRLAAERNRKALIEKLDLNLEAAKPVSRRSATAYQAHDTAFHRLIVRAADNDELLDCYERIAGRVWALRCRLIRTVRAVTRSQSHHQEVRDFLAAGNIAAAEARLRDHVHNSYYVLRRVGAHKGPLAAAEGRQPGDRLPFLRPRQR